MYTVKCFKPHTNLPLGFNFYVLNRGQNSGRPSFSPNPNCFVVSTQTEQDRLMLYYACQALHLNGRFRRHLVGSVIELLRISDFKAELDRAHAKFLATQEDIATTVKRINDANSLAQVTEKKRELIVKLHRCYLHEAFIK